MAQTALTITVTAATKAMALDVSIGLRETVDVTVTGFTVQTGDTYVLSVIRFTADGPTYDAEALASTADSGGTDVALSKSGSDLVGTLDLNKTALINAMAEGDSRRATFQMQLYNRTDENLIGACDVDILNHGYVPGAKATAPS